MPVLKNINPLGQVDLPLVGRQGEPIGTARIGCLEPGEEFEVTDDHAALLLEQTGNYEPVDDAAKAILESLQKVEAADEVEEVEQPDVPPAPSVPPAPTDENGAE